MPAAAATGIERLTLPLHSPRRSLPSTRRLSRLLDHRVHGLEGGIKPGGVLQVAAQVLEERIGDGYGEEHRREQDRVRLRRFGRPKLLRQTPRDARRIEIVRD